MLEAIRQEMRHLGIDAFLIPRGDMFSGEEVPAADERLAFISGFTGSAGMAVVTSDKAALFSDGRYTLQMDAETNASWQCFTQPEVSVTAWLAEQLAGCRIGFDPWLMPMAQRKRFDAALSVAKAELVAVDRNPVDAIWPDRPAAPASAALPYGIALAGRTQADKISDVLAQLAEHQPQAEAMVISDPAALAWLLNIRGRDLDHTPVLLAFAVLDRSGRVTVLADEHRFAACASEAMEFAALEDLPQILAQYGKGKVVVDPSTCPQAIADMLAGEVLSGECPITLLKAIKTEAEVRAFEEAHRMDAVAMIRFLCWLEDTLVQRPVREVEVAEKLVAFRSASAQFISPSFATICGGGSNGAIVHYRAEEGKDQDIPSNNLCLIDSGGQYLGATTDITRTVATGTPPQEMAAAFTTVLKAHIALAVARFPEGTNGVQLDAITRAPLWARGMDYAHGTGHGVGCSLSVHEGPASISKRGERPILPGMILSNEPGYYVTGEYGIRIENLIHIQRDATDGMLFSSSLTLVPIDRRLIIAPMLSTAERDWLNAYHARVCAEIGPLIDALGEDRLTRWFAEATAPLA